MSTPDAPPPFLTDAQADALAMDICALLHGVPIGQAVAILRDRATGLLQNAHCVDKHTPTFRYFTAESHRLAGADDASPNAPAPAPADPRQ